jgi:hypothetical protein
MEEALLVHRRNHEPKMTCAITDFIDYLQRFVSGEPLRNLVDKELGY